jgi:tetratricopeptide (TPR) repeat protein
MAEPVYLNFDLQIEPAPEGYRARVVASPLDRACCSEFALSLPETRLSQSAHVDEIKAFGTRLFRAVFADEIYSYLRRSQDEAERQGADGLRIRLLLTDVPELADLPWEYLYDPTHEQFLSLSTKTPIVRYLDLSQRVQPLAVKRPLRILVMISSPEGQPPLDVDEEWARLSQALAELQAEGRVELELLDGATLPALQTQLRKKAYHVFHYVGHGGFDERLQDGVLILEGEEGQSQAVKGEVLGALLHNEPSLRLALLNACEGARGSQADPFAGTAQGLVRKRIPAVIAMQTRISDEAAKIFAYEFYRALADDYPVDKALTEARVAIYSQGNEWEWGAPVLFMRSSDARLDEGAPPPDHPSRSRAQVRLGPLAVPVTPLLAVPLVVAVALLLLGFVFLGPAEMGGRFNVAVADVGMMDAAGRMTSSEDSQLLTEWIVAGLEEANDKSERGNIELWHDGLSLTEKRTKLGMVSGQTAEERLESARELAEKVNAHVVVYGHLTSAEEPAALILEFYVAPRVRVESVATIGRYQLGDPLPVPKNLTSEPLALESLAARVQDRSSLLFWLLLGLRDDLLGRPNDALATFRQAETELPGLREQGDGKEHLYYFKGRAALFLDFYEEAEDALQAALASNPQYARAHIALGSVYLDIAQTLESPEQRLSEPKNLEQAVNHYQQGVDFARASNDPLTEVIGHLALGHAYRVQGETWYVLQDYAEAEHYFKEAIRELKLVLEPLDTTKQYRLLAQAYAALGAAHIQNGQLQGVLGDGIASRQEFEAAREAYAGCITQGEKAPEDELLHAEIIAHQEKGCQRWDGIVEGILLDLPGGRNE